MKPRPFSRFFLYRHRFTIGYWLLGINFISLVFLLPLITPAGLSDAELATTVRSSNLSLQSLLQGDIINLPFHLLQHLSLKILGLHFFSIKLPSILLGIAAALTLILLLNRWFKNNVAVLTSIILTVSTSFLFLATNGTPDITLILLPALLLWLGSKIHNAKHPAPLVVTSFAFVLGLSLFSPGLPLLVLAILIFLILNPHLRFTLRSLPSKVKFSAALTFLLPANFLIFSLSRNSALLSQLLGIHNFQLQTLQTRIHTALLPFFTWNNVIEHTWLSPLVNISLVALALIGLISTSRNFFKTKAPVALFLGFFSVCLAGFIPHLAILLLLPIAILAAYGLRYLINTWYSIFPENPYARFAAIFPLGALLGLLITSDLSHFIFGYRYAPAVANQFNTDLQLIYHHIPSTTPLLVPVSSPEYDFYKLLERYSGYQLITAIPNTTNTNFAVLGRPALILPKSAQLTNIITSAKSINSDRIYVYTINQSVNH